MVLKKAEREELADRWVEIMQQGLEMIATVRDEAEVTVCIRAGSLKYAVDQWVKDVVAGAQNP